MRSEMASPKNSQPPDRKTKLNDQRTPKRGSRNSERNLSLIAVPAAAPSPLAIGSSTPQPPHCPLAAPSLPPHFRQRSALASSRPPSSFWFLRRCFQGLFVDSCSALLFPEQGGGEGSVLPSTALKKARLPNRSVKKEV